MEAVHRGIPVTAIGDDTTTLGYLALGRYDPVIALCAMSLLDTDLYGELRYVPSAPLLERITTCWALVTPCVCGTGDEDDCHHAWQVDFVPETTSGAVPVTFLDLAPPADRRPDMTHDTPIHPTPRHTEPPESGEET
ncbi:hypothetical protein [Embleya sp. NBC_00896]|uniref:hypothetical protein n=1 Tax=Embleya sp. NBC_00896 TaxID=2975961 RepID=UPI00386B0367|nr:hypothetical protein OG928_48240 [Embleya sp. NBC_00896]